MPAPASRQISSEFLNAFIGFISGCQGRMHLSPATF
jgi:hypothetical protein